MIDIVFETFEIVVAQAESIRLPGAEPRKGKDLLALPVQFVNLRRGEIVTEQCRGGIPLGNSPFDDLFADFRCRMMCRAVLLLRSSQVTRTRDKTRSFFRRWAPVGPAGNNGWDSGEVSEPRGGPMRAGMIKADGMARTSATKSTRSCHIETVSS